MKVAFLHPDLGLGGAERLVVDIAAGLVAKGDEVSMYTSHYEPERSFEETRSGIFPVTVHGDWLPRHVFVVALWHPTPDVFICDQVSAYVPILRLLSPRARIIFYCHFPDKLLAPHQTIMRKIYRFPFDLFEEIATGMAHRVLVNSQFTERVYHDNFPIHRLGCSRGPEVLYPAVEMERYAHIGTSANATEPCIFVSINRFERKKAIDRAVHGFADLVNRLGDDDRPRAKLVIAGGYDTRVSENVSYHEELVALAQVRTRNSLTLSVAPFPCPHSSPRWHVSQSLGLRVADGRMPWDEEEEEEEAGTAAERPEVYFVRSFSDADKMKLLEHARAVIYTPSNEHFGIVPLECMAAARPVIAVASGGPLETVKHDETGLLLDDPPSASDVGDAMIRLFRHPEEATRFGREGRRWVHEKFSRDSLGARAHEHCESVTAEQWTWGDMLVRGALVASLGLVAVAISGMEGLFAR